MTRSSFRPITSIGLVAAVLNLLGCEKPPQTSLSSTPTPASSSTPSATDGAKAPTPKFITEWSANPPAGILMVSGEQYGYPDPCGCTDGQLGGLGRRYHLLEMLQEKGWPVAKIDLGNLIHYRSDTSRGGVTQDKIKFDIILEALSAMKYDAVALGPEDLRPRVMETLATLLNNQPPKYPVFLAANIIPQAGLESTLGSIKITKAGPITIGITAVIDPADFDQLQAQDADAKDLKVKPPDEVIPALLEELKKQAKIRVLMVQGPYEEAKRLAEKFPGFDIVVGTSEFEEPDERPEMGNDDKTLLVRNVGKKGKYVSLIGFFPGSTPMIQYRRQPLDELHFHQAEPMRQLIDVDYQERMKREKIVENFTRMSYAQAPDAKFVGAKECQACHPKTYEKWTTTKHARAFEALENPKRNRVFDAECISCHTTGFGLKTGWVSAEATPFLKGNQCENCHGPASKHVADPDNIDFRKPMHMSKAMADATGFCTKCHDQDNDHNYNFESRYAQIFHKGLDVYTDPKVHLKAKDRVNGGGQ